MLDGVQVAVVERDADVSAPDRLLEQVERVSERDDLDVGRAQMLHLRRELLGCDREDVVVVGDAVVPEDPYAFPGGRTVRAHLPRGDARLLMGADRAMVETRLRRRHAVPARRQLTEDLLDLVEHRPRGEAFLDQPASGLRPASRLDRIADALDDRSGERCRVLGRHEPAGFAVDDRGRRPADVGRDDRTLERQCFERDDRQPFTARRQDDHVGSADVRRRKRNEADELRVLRDAEVGGELLVRLQLAPVADERQPDPWVVANHLR